MRQERVPMVGLNIKLYQNNDANTKKVTWYRDYGIQNGSGDTKTNDLMAHDACNNLTELIVRCQL